MGRYRDRTAEDLRRDTIIAWWHPRYREAPMTESLAQLREDRGEWV